MKPSCKFIFASHSGTTLGTKFCGHSNEVQMGIWKKICGRYRWPLWGWGWGLGSSTVFNLHLLYTIQLFLCLICLYIVQFRTTLVCLFRVIYILISIPLMSAEISKLLSDIDTPNINRRNIQLALVSRLTRRGFLVQLQPAWQWN